MKAMNLNAGDEDNAWSRDPLKLVCNRISRGKDELVNQPEEAPDDVERIICQGLTGGPGVDPGEPAHGGALIYPRLPANIAGRERGGISAIFCSGPRGRCWATQSTARAGSAGSTQDRRR